MAESVSIHASPIVINTSPIVKDDIDISQVKNIILIDKTIEDPEIFFLSNNNETLSIYYNYYTDREKLLDYLQKEFINIDRVGFVFNNSMMNNKVFLNDELFFTEDDIIRFEDEEHIELDLMNFKVGVVTRSPLENQLIEEGILTPKGFLTRNLNEATTISETYNAPARSLNKKMGQGLVAIGYNPRTVQLIKIQTKYKNAIIRPDAKDLERSKEGPLFVSVEPIEPMNEETQQKLDKLIKNHSSVIEMDDNNPGYIKVDILNIDRTLEKELNELGVLQEKGTLETVFGKAGSNVQNTQARPRVEIERDLEDEEEVKAVAGSEVKAVAGSEEPEQEQRQR